MLEIMDNAAKSFYHQKHVVLPDLSALQSLLVGRCKHAKYNQLHLNIEISSMYDYEDSNDT